MGKRGGAPHNKRETGERGLGEKIKEKEGKGRGTWGERNTSKQQVRLF